MYRPDPLKSASETTLRTPARRAPVPLCAPLADFVDRPRHLARNQRRESGRLCEVRTGAIDLCRAEAASDQPAGSAEAAQTILTCRRGSRYVPETSPRVELRRHF